MYDCTGRIQQTGTSTGINNLIRTIDLATYYEPVRDKT